jgi:hypothetical protein
MLSPSGFLVLMIVLISVIFLVLYYFAKSQNAKEKIRREKIRHDDVLKEEEARYKVDCASSDVRIKEMEVELISIFKELYRYIYNDEEIVNLDLKLVFLLIYQHRIDQFTSSHFKSMSRDYHLTYNVDSYGIISSKGWDDILGKIAIKIIDVELESLKLFFSELFVLRNRLSQTRYYRFREDNQFISWYMSKVFYGIQDDLNNSFLDFMDENNLSNNESVDHCKSGLDYEHLIASIINESNMKWTAKVSKASGDQGLDIFAEDDFGFTVAIQTKFYSGAVGNKAVQEVLGALSFYKTDVAMVVTNSRFTKSAEQLAKISGVILIHHDSLLSELSDLSKKNKFQ